MSQKASPAGVLQKKIDATTTAARSADHRKNLLEARARGAKAGLKTARKAFKQAKKAARKAAKEARQAHKTLRTLVKRANKKPAKAKAGPQVKSKPAVKKAR